MAVFTIVYRMTTLSPHVFRIHCSRQHATQQHTRFINHVPCRGRGSV